MMGQHMSRCPGIHTSNTTHLNNVCLMLGQRRGQWASIKPTMFQCVVFAGQTSSGDHVLMCESYPRKRATLTQCWANVGPAS